MNTNIKYWLIYSDEEGRKAKPFYNVDTMRRYVENNKKDIIVINKTKVIE
ncbi:hypothetical protein [Clostridium sp.]